MKTVSVTPPATCTVRRAAPAACAVGRTRIYCRDACKKAAYEARRSKFEGAVVVRVVERVIVQEHDINECVHRVKASPVAVRHVLNAVVRLIDARTLGNDPKWERAFRAAEAIELALHQVRVPRWFRRSTGASPTRSPNGSHRGVGCPSGTAHGLEGSPGRLACLEGDAAVALPAGVRPLYDVEGAAAYLNIPARWVADAVRDGKIRHERFGKHIRFAQEHLDEFLAACEQPVTASVVRLKRDRRRSRL